MWGERGHSPPLASLFKGRWRGIPAAPVGFKQIKMPRKVLKKTFRGIYRKIRKIKAYLKQTGGI